jgi:hypothetical protein
MGIGVQFQTGVTAFLFRTESRLTEIRLFFYAIDTRASPQGVKAARSVKQTN